jgi:hypothetical protein
MNVGAKKEIDLVSFVTVEKEQLVQSVPKVNGNAS